MINGVHHVSFSVTDLDAMLGFYQNLLCLKKVRGSDVAEASKSFQNVVGMDGAAYRHAWLRGGNIIIEFFQYTHIVGAPVQIRPACDAGIRHLAFDVTDIQDEYRRLRAEGVEFMSEPQHLPAIGLWAVYGRDPEGNIFELQEILPDSVIVDRLETYAPLP